MSIATTPYRFSDQFYAGARACIPVVISVAAYGVVWGVLARGAGLSLLEVILMSGLVFAGSAQFVALDLWTVTPSTLPIGPLILAALIVNLRYLLLTATLRPLFRPDQQVKGALLMGIVSDETWAMTVGEMAKGRGTVAFLLGGGVFAYACWMATTVIGHTLGSAIDDPRTYGLDFAFTATFLALLLGMWKGKGDIIPWLVAALAAIISAKLIPGSWYILIGGIVGSLAGAIADKVRHVD
ncbi:4-azaleucine resistance probable transporter AzlC [Devosia sp. YR412]|uniref:AzlC family ABC transporter permease n=1 Tax=Devosia sp. YR412 TaxID=1881030 RepID=UPI0008B65506|nr:AzlC family ABC transporter permease [Devosia sp. YR412]SEQ30098.1 4-azaleucine resistance probable transporter AzlC [Devosia sp. YR412]